MADRANQGVTEPYPSDAVLPSQYWGDGGLVQPEKRLLAAVLEEAIAVLARANPRPGSEAEQAAIEANHWMDSDERIGPFAFASICDVLGLDPDGVRQALPRIRSGERDYVRPRMSAGKGRHRIREKRRRTRNAA